jgi:hypothetical protein
MDRALSPRLRAVISLWLVVALACGSVGATGCATVKTRDDLSPDEVAALEESQTRVNSYRHCIRLLKVDSPSQTPDRAKEQEVILRLQRLVHEEIDLQEAIIRKDPALHIKASALLEDIKKTTKTTGDVFAVAGEVGLYMLATPPAIVCLLWMLSGINRP